MTDNMKSEIDQIFDLLDKWRLFPAYQLERRADIFFALFLPQIMERHLGGQPILKIIPEFPVRIGTIYPHIPINKSFKIDYLLVTASKVFLVELKTENTSRRDGQDNYLNQAKAVNTNGLVEGIVSIYNATNSKTKYRRLMLEMEAISWLKSEAGNWVNICQDKEIEIVYIQPGMDSKHKDETVITFEEVASIVEKADTEIGLRFAQSLRTWKKGANLA